MSREYKNVNPNDDTNFSHPTFGNFSQFHFDSKGSVLPIDSTTNRPASLNVEAYCGNITLPHTESVFTGPNPSCSTAINVGHHLSPNLTRLEHPELNQIPSLPRMNDEYENAEILNQVPEISHSESNNAVFADEPTQKSASPAPPSHSESAKPQDHQTEVPIIASANFHQPNPDNSLASYNSDLIKFESIKSANLNLEPYNSLNVSNSNSFNLPYQSTLKNLNEEIQPIVSNVDLSQRQEDRDPEMEHDLEEYAMPEYVNEGMKDLMK